MHEPSTKMGEKRRDSQRKGGGDKRTNAGLAGHPTEAQVKHHAEDGSHAADQHALHPAEFGQLRFGSVGVGAARTDDAAPRHLQRLLSNELAPFVRFWRCLMLFTLDASLSLRFGWFRHVNLAPIVRCWPSKICAFFSCHFPFSFSFVFPSPLLLLITLNISTAFPLSLLCCCGCCCLSPSTKSNIVGRTVPFSSFSKVLR